MNDFLKGIFGHMPIGEPEVLHEHRTSYVLEELDEANAFEKIERTVLDENGPRTEEIQAVSKMGCGHFVGFKSKADLSGTCSFCGCTLCYRCMIRCVSCGKIGCMNCMTLTDDPLPICKKCRLLQIGKRSLSVMNKILKKNAL